LAGAAAALRDQSGRPLPPTEQADYERWLASASEALAESVRNAALAAGRAMTLDQAVAYALDDTGGPAQA
jgi:hypothetical protein